MQTSREILEAGMDGNAGSGRGDLVSSMRDWIAGEREAIAREAGELAERFWDQHWEVDQSGGKQRRGYLGVRVRRRGQGVGIEWYRSVPAFRKKGSSGPPKMFHRYLARGRGYEYPMGVFRAARARDWELALARDLEPRFGQLRRRLDVLTRMGRQVLEYERALGLAKSGSCGESESGTPQEEQPDATETGRK